MKPTVLGLFFVTVGSTAVALLVAALIACSGSQTAAVASDVAAKTLTCVIEKEAAGEAPKQIAIDCAIAGGETAVIDLLARMDQRAARKFGDGGAR